MSRVRIEFTGDFAELKKWASKVESAPEVLELLGDQLAEETIELIREGFETETDPYGDEWPSPIFREGQALSDTGGLRASWHRVYASRHGFEVASGKLYAKWHQGGTGIYGPRKRRIRPKRGSALGPLPDGNFYRSVKGTPRRRMVPDSGQLPARWRRRLVETSHEVLTEYFR
jgi:phage gpG-like protein